MSDYLYATTKIPENYSGDVIYILVNKSLKENVESIYKYYNKENLAVATDLLLRDHLSPEYIDSDITGVCPVCNENLKTRMFDIDGTNLEESTFCTECGYGKPWMKV